MLKLASHHENMGRCRSIFIFFYEMDANDQLHQAALSPGNKRIGLAPEFST